jgi:hypothetical protein
MLPVESSLSILCAHSEERLTFFFSQEVRETNIDIDTKETKQEFIKQYVDHHTKRPRDKCERNQNIYT